MTVVLDPPAPAPGPVGPTTAAHRASASSSESGSSAPPIGGGRSPVLLAMVWLGVVLLSLWLVLYLLEPLFQQRTQADLLSGYEAAISTSANEANGLAGISVATTAPGPGDAVAILEIGAIRMQQVVVEGAGSSQTQEGPGHVPGTAGPGQPGNSVIVGRRATFGAPFGRLDQLHEGDAILVTTTQGQTVYHVASVDERTIISPSDADVAPPTASSTVTSSDGAGPSAGSSDDAGTVERDALFGRTDDDRLTLVTSAAAAPWNTSRAVVVTAALEGTPFRPTPQGGRVEGATGTSGDPGGWAPLVLALQAFVLAAVAAVVLYRRSSIRVAYLLTVPPFIACSILLAESASRLLPAWM